VRRARCGSRWGSSTGSGGCTFWKNGRPKSRTCLPLRRCLRARSYVGIIHSFL